MSCCVYSCTQYSLHTEYMLLTHADVLLCLQLHTVQSPYTVHASNPRWCLAVPTAAHSTVRKILTLWTFAFDLLLSSGSHMQCCFYCRLNCSYNKLSTSVHITLKSSLTTNSAHQYTSHYTAVSQQTQHISKHRTIQQSHNKLSTSVHITI